MKALALFPLLVLIGCISKSPDSDRSFTEKMNGNAYETATLVGPVVFLGKETAIVRKIHGVASCHTNGLPAPAGRAKVEALAGVTVVASATAELDGTFLLSVPVRKGGSYSLRAEAVCGVAEKRLSTWSGDGDLDGMELVLRHTGRID